MVQKEQEELSASEMVQKRWQLTLWRTTRDHPSITDADKKEASAEVAKLEKELADSLQGKWSNDIGRLNHDLTEIKLVPFTPLTQYP